MNTDQLLIFVAVVLLIINVEASIPLQVYIVYLGQHNVEKTSREIEAIHRTYLHSVKSSKEEAESCMVYRYKNVINGFSALLSPQEAQTMLEMEGVVSVFPSEAARLHTTRSWDFVSLHEANLDANKEKILEKAGDGKDVVVGVFDSGVWPESKSFTDDGMEPVPASWKGICQTGDGFSSHHCNRKLVGARYYVNAYEATYGPLNPKRDFRSARDISGHGTHTASTVGGRRVANAGGLGGIDNGTARGGASLVRLAIYKVCWQNPHDIEVCFEADMLAAFDDAVADGVDVISVSIGSFSARSFERNGIAMGSLHAVKKSIVVACSAGNSGPIPSTVSNVAPWVITVAASSIDRVFSSPVKLGNGVTIEGQSITPFDEASSYPLVYAGDVEIPGSTTNRSRGFCFKDTLSPDLVKGKAVFCRREDRYATVEVARAGGAAAVLENSQRGMQVVLEPYLIPATIIPLTEVPTISNYTESVKSATAALTPVQTLTGTKPAPFMASFTSRGPNRIDPNILKPDITAPGLNILAAWTEAESSSPDKILVSYQFKSGTSMSCPHVSAVAALLKTIHHNWSSAAIRSDLITTAGLKNNQGSMITDPTGNPADPFQFGGGHIRPAKAADPGLIYNASYTDYLLYLCSIKVRIDPTFTCPEHSVGPENLNYPSLAVPNLRDSVTVVRTVTNVGAPKCKYVVDVKPPLGILVKIWPPVLLFNHVGEESSFTVTVVGNSNVNSNGYCAYSGYCSYGGCVHRRLLFIDGYCSYAFCTSINRRATLVICTFDS